MNKKLLIITILLIPIAVISFFYVEANFNLPKKEQEIKVRLKLSKTNEVIELPLEEYIIGVVAAEMPAAFHEEALKAQAVASRTYALSKLNNISNYDLIDTVNNQAFIDQEGMKEKWSKDFEKYYQKIKKCVEATKSQIVTYNNKPVTTYYFAMSNGKTENSELVFKESKPYLKSVESEYDNENLKNYEVESRLTKKEFCEKLDITCKNLKVEITNRSESNRVNIVKVNDKEITGVDFRKLLDLRSTDFTIKITGDYVYITTKGYGHGVGMSQYGANGMASNGTNYQDILKHYYQNTKISNLNDV